MRQIARHRWRQRIAPAQIGGRLNLPGSTVHAHPESRIYVDVTKFGIADGGGHRFVEPERDTGKSRSAGHDPSRGRAYAHAVIDDDSCLTHTEICANEKTVMAIGALARTVASFADRGVNG